MGKIFCVSTIEGEKLVSSFYINKCSCENKTIEQLQSEIRILELQKLSGKIKNKKISAQKCKALMHLKLSLILKFIGNKQNDNAAEIVSKLLEEYPEFKRKKSSKSVLQTIDGFGKLEKGIVTKGGTLKYISKKI